MAHLVKDLDDVHVHLIKDGRKRRYELHGVKPKSGEVVTVAISNKAAEFLIQWGMNSGS